MIGIDLNGKERHYRPQSALVGIGFQKIILDFEDVRPENIHWLCYSVFTRLCPKRKENSIEVKDENKNNF